VNVDFPAKIQGQLERSFSDLRGHRKIKKSYFRLYPRVSREYPLNPGLISNHPSGVKADQDRMLLAIVEGIVDHLDLCAVGIKADWAQMGKLRRLGFVYQM
jgi:hypothetical protein